DLDSELWTRQGRGDDWVYRADDRGFAPARAGRTSGLSAGRRLFRLVGARHVEPGRGQRVDAANLGVPVPQPLPDACATSVRGRPCGRNLGHWFSLSPPTSAPVDRRSSAAAAPRREGRGIRLLRRAERI